MVNSVDDTIDVVVTCGTNSEAYTRFLIETAVETASNPDAFHFKLGLNDDTVDPAKLKALTDLARVDVFDCRNSLPYGSMSHGTSLNSLFEHVTAPLTLICDADIAFLSRGWDDMLRERISGDCVAVGASYRADYSARNGFEKFQGHPNIYGTLVRSDVVRECGVDFRPASPSGVVVEVDASTAALCGLPVGMRWFKDTGYELSSKVRERGYRGIAMDVYTCDTPGVCVLPPGQRGDEYQLDGVPILTHIGRSVFRNLDTDPIAVGWKRAVRSWLDDSDERI